MVERRKGEVTAMRTDHRLSEVWIGGKRTVTRSALEARWLLFFNALGMNPIYEPETFWLSSNQPYTPDFKTDILQYVEIKPSLDLLVSESAAKCAQFSKEKKVDVYAFYSDRVSLDNCAFFDQDKLYAPTAQQMYKVLRKDPEYVNIVIAQANQAKLSHFVTAKDVLILETIPDMQRNLSPERQKNQRVREKRKKL